MKLVYTINHNCQDMPARMLAAPAVDGESHGDGVRDEDDRCRRDAAAGGR